METTGKQFVEFWTWAANKGLMNINSARSFSAPVKQILIIDDDWEMKDVSTFDVDDLLSRFKNKRYQDFTPNTLRTYERRFRQALDLFLQYVRDPASWKYKKPASSKKKATTGKPGNNRLIQPTDNYDDPTTSIGSSNISMVDYPFVLRENCIVRLKLPVDLRTADVDRLVTFLRTLVIELNQS